MEGPDWERLCSHVSARTFLKAMEMKPTAYALADEAWNAATTPELRGTLRRPIRTTSYRRIAVCTLWAACDISNAWIVNLDTDFVARAALVGRANVGAALHSSGTSLPALQHVQNLSGPAWQQPPIPRHALCIIFVGVEGRSVWSRAGVVRSQEKVLFDGELYTGGNDCFARRKERMRLEARNGHVVLEGEVLAQELAGGVEGHLADGRRAALLRCCLRRNEQHQG